MNSKIIKGLLLLFIITGLLVGCGRSETPVRVAAHPWPGYELMFLAKMLGWLEQDKVVLVETSTAPESVELLKTGKIDAAALTLDEVLRVRDDGLDLTIVLIFDESAGADVVLASPGLKKLSDLKGMRIGVEHSAVGEVMLIKLLEAGGLGRQDVEVIDIAINRQSEYWKEGKFDAVVSYYPEATKLQEAGAVSIFDSRNAPGLIYDVLAVRTDVIHKHSQGLKHLIKGHFRALDHMRKFPQDAGYRLAGRLGISGFDVSSVYRGLKIPSLASNRDLLSKDTGLTGSARQVNTILLNAGLVREEANYKKLVDASYLPAPGL